MCVRINNIHALIVMFEELEEHLYSCMRTALPKPISAFGYVSSDPGELSPRPMTDKSLQSNPICAVQDRDTTSEGPASVKDARRGMTVFHSESHFGGRRGGGHREYSIRYYGRVSKA